MHEPEAQPLIDEFRPSFREVVDLVARGRPGAVFTTGSPVEFITRDGVTCVITFDPAVPPRSV